MYKERVIWLLILSSLHCYDIVREVIRQSVNYAVSSLNLLRNHVNSTLYLPPCCKSSSTSFYRFWPCFATAPSRKASYQRLKNDLFSSQLSSARDSIRTTRSTIYRPIANAC